VHRLFAATTLLTGCTTRPIQPATLKSAYKGHFLVGTAINRTVATGNSTLADNFNRDMALVEKDTAVVLEQFNQIVRRTT